MKDIQQPERSAASASASKDLFPPNPRGERITDETVEKLLDLLRSAPPTHVITVGGTLPIIEALYKDRAFLKSVIAKHDANMRELREAYGIEITEEEKQAEEDSKPDPKSLYSLL